MPTQYFQDMPSFVQRAQMAEGNERSIDTQTLANLFQQMQNDRYSQMTPHEVAIRGGEAAKASAVNNPESMGLYRLGQEGNWRSQAATGEYDEGVVKGRIAEKLAELKAKVPKHIFDQETAELEQFHRGLEMAIPQLEQIPAGMMRNQAAMQLAQQFNIDPKTVAMISVNGGLNDLEGLKVLKAQIGYALENTISQRQKMQPEELKAVTNLEQSRIAAETSKYGADARKKDVEADQLADLRKKAAAGNPEAFLMLADLADDPKEKARYIDLATKAALRREAERRAMAVGQVSGPGVTKLPAVESTNPYANQAEPSSSYTVDKVYSGKTGNYKYKGGDPSKKENWEKVN